MLVNREVILCKEETTYNTDSTPTGASNAILVEKPAWGFDSARMIERPAIRTSFGKLQRVFGGTLKMVSFDVEMKGSGAAGTAPEIGPLFKACGMTETIVGATSVTYAFSSTISDYKSLTVWYYQDGKAHKMTGCIPMSVSFNVDVGGIGKWSFTIVGHDTGETDVTLATPTYNAYVPVPFIGATFAVQSYAAIVSKLSLDFGLTTAKPTSVNATDGFGTIQITSRNPTGSCNPQNVTVATHDFLGKFKSGASGTLSTGVIGSSAGNRWAMSCGKIYYDAPSPGDQEGIRTLEVPFSITDETTANSDLSIAFT